MYILSNDKPLVRLHARASTKIKAMLRLIFVAGELARRRNPIFASLLVTFEKLQKLGLIYCNGKIVFLDTKETP
jgi:hypothetical protein